VRNSIGLLIIEGQESMKTCVITLAGGEHRPYFDYRTDFLNTFQVF